MVTTASRVTVIPAIICKPKIDKFIPGTRYKCVGLLGERKWWQFWKPKAVAGIYRYMGED